MYRPRKKGGTVVHRKLQANVEQRELGRRVLVEHQVQVVEAVHQSRTPMGHPIRIVMPHLHIIAVLGRGNQVGFNLQAPAPRRNAIADVMPLKLNTRPIVSCTLFSNCTRNGHRGIFRNRLCLIIRGEQRSLSIGQANRAISFSTHCSPTPAHCSTPLPRHPFLAVLEISGKHRRINSRQDAGEKPARSAMSFILTPFWRKNVMRSYISFNSSIIKTGFGHEVNQNSSNIRPESCR